MVMKRKDPGRAYSPARKALSRSGLGLGRSPRRGLSTSFQASSKPVPSARPGASKAPIRRGSANVKVVVRVRPLSKREEENNARVIVDVVDEKMIVFDPKREEESFFFRGTIQKGRDMLKKQNKNMQYLFDRVFGPEADNGNVFEGSTKSIINSVLDGFNCSVFVYGATGAGKTFTMLGTKENPGITFRTMVELFYQMESQKHEKDFDIGVSYLEVYNETVRDLLNPSSGPLFLREDGAGVVVAGLKMERISDPNRMFELLEHGNLHRTQHATDANAESSRSHAVFQVYIKMKTKSTAQTKMVKLSMIDLAGSERASATGGVGMRAKEGSNINKSLLALGNCINALADGLRHIPYRDSKLTRLLKDSLGGNCQTVMIANISPAHPTIEDTQNTLKYATRAKSIKCQIKRNVVSVELHVSHYIKMVEDLQAENDRLKSENEALKREKEELKLQKSATECVDPSPAQTAPFSHLPPAVAAAVAAISSKPKLAAVTSTVGVNTSPCKVLQQKTEELERLRKKAENLYTQKAKLHQRYLNMDSSDKVLRWRIKLKQRAIDRVQAMSSTPTRFDQVQVKGGKSLDQFKGRLNSVNECQVSVSADESEINRQLEVIRDELQRLGVFDEVAPYMKAFELEFLNLELSQKCQHLEKLVEYLDKGFESQEEVLKTVSALFRKYYVLVRGHGHMTNELAGQHEAVMRSLEGLKSVQWKSGNEISVFHPADDSAEMPVTSVTGDHLKFVNDSTPSLLPSFLSEEKEWASKQNEALVQSPLCSSSSNPSSILDLDTATMLATMRSLDSKVDSILNTSISSTAGEVGLGPIPSEDKEQPLNVTFERDSNLNSTFTKDDDEKCKATLNETFDLKEENVRVSLTEPGDVDNQMSVSAPSVSDFNSIFSLGDNASAPNELRDSASENALEYQKSPQLRSPSGIPYQKRFPSPQVSTLKVLKPPNPRSPLAADTKKDLSPSPSVDGTLKKQVTSSSVSPALSSTTNLKKSTSTISLSPSTSALTAASLVKKTNVSPAFAVPAPVSVKSSIPPKRPGGGVADKKKALNPNLYSQKPSSKILNINRKPLGTKPNLNLNTPSKVKLAWNKENRSITTVTANKPVAKIRVPKNSTNSEPAAKAPPAPTPVPLNDTFTK
ncbi:Kinesin-like protein KIF18A [Frankliniella fusca]|uniref:Kinesin-like protein KIF18A n=1 Tax=Frankliniella fusca TaxID=407009 RepID=A0AAE1HLB9_9NEOP|nr:Kinesin-like protein KIF18A [Frankliniella fusca]